MIILGITAPISENVSACLLRDGKLLAFAEEERFNRIKHAPRMIPRQSIEYCLKEGGVSINDVDIIAVGYDSVFGSWAKDILANIKERNRKIILENGAYMEYFLKMYRLRQFFSDLDPTGRSWKKIRYITHHRAHAASAVRFSGFSESIFISLDGVGENNAGLFGAYKNGKMKIMKSVPMNQSLGWIYSTATDICGFKKHSQEGKLMGLAAYGKVRPKLLRNIAQITPDGYKLFPGWLRIMEKRLPKRKRNEEISDIHKDLAATVQNFLELAVSCVARGIHEKTGIRNICLAGGVALNCDMNSKIMETGLFDRIFIQPAANDAGTALGAAAEIYYRETGRECDPLRHPYFGPPYSPDQIEAVLKESKLKYRKISSLQEVARLLADGKIVSWFSGRMEFGPRSLGGRSILANPQVPGMKDKINREVKHRESWRPFAPSVLAEYADDYFENYHPSPFMLLTFRTKKEKMSEISAAIHVDGTARVQEVSKLTNPRYHELISEFQKITSIPVLLNTSLNDNGQPICMTPQDAIRTFFSTGIDALVLEDYLIEKNDG